MTVIRSISDYKSWGPLLDSINSFIRQFEKVADVAKDTSEYPRLLALARHAAFEQWCADAKVSPCDRGRLYRKIQEELESRQGSYPSRDIVYIEKLYKDVPLEYLVRGVWKSTGCTD